MTVLALGLFAASAALAAWSYLAYPAVLKRLARRAAPPPSSAAPAAVATPVSVDVIVAAADEEAVIGDRVRNLLAQEAPGPLRVAIGCDGSADATAARAREAGGDRVSVTEFPARRGKAAVLNDLVAASSADVLVFTDANTRFEPAAVSELCAPLVDPRMGVGAVCGRLVFESDGATPESEFWDRETGSKELEGRLGLCLGANGAIYSARRLSVAPLPPDTTSMDDFLIPLGILRRGGRVVFAPAAVAREPAPSTLTAERSRRFRIGVGAGQILRRERWVWNLPRRGRLAFIFFSRKTARWLAPVLFLASALVALASPALRPVGVLVLVAALGMSIAGSPPARVARSAVGRLYYFAVLNLVLAAGVTAGLCGYSRPVWKPQR